MNQSAMHLWMILIHNAESSPLIFSSSFCSFSLSLWDCPCCGGINSQYMLSKFFLSLIHLFFHSLIHSYTKQAIHGRVRIFNHLFFNYRKIYDMLPKAQPPKRIFVVRKEQLWEDWYKVDAMLQNEFSVLQSSATAAAGKAVTAAPPSGAASIPEATATEAIHVRNTKGMKLPVSRDVSDVRKQQLCKALEPEYKVYFSILDRAENIGKQELKESTRLAQTNCPNLDIPSMVASHET